MASLSIDRGGLMNRHREAITLVFFGAGFESRFADVELNHPWFLPRIIHRRYVVGWLSTGQVDLQFCDDLLSLSQFIDVEPHLIVRDVGSYNLLGKTDRPPEGASHQNRYEAGAKSLYTLGH